MLITPLWQRLTLLFPSRCSQRQRGAPHPIPTLGEHALLDGESHVHFNEGWGFWFTLVTTRALDLRGLEVGVSPLNTLKLLQAPKPVPQALEDRLQPCQPLFHVCRSPYHPLTLRNPYLSACGPLLVPSPCLECPLPPLCTPPSCLYFSTQFKFLLFLEASPDHPICKLVYP